MTVATTRQTKYCQAIAAVMQKCGHATNAELLDELRREFPNLSATTVHRATARLADRGELAFAPTTQSGAMRYDTNTTPHDHFSCTKCGRLVDADIAEQVSELLTSSIEGCRISGRIIVSGICKQCNKENA